jgi:hypothetical protein
MAVGSRILEVDYNSIRTKVASIMGTAADGGTGQNGYGQTLVSSSVAVGNTVTATQWNNLKWDIYNARVHQTGNTPTIVTAVSGQPIRYGAGQPNFQLDTLANTVITDKFALGEAQFIVEAGTSATRSTSWNTSLSTTLTVTFGSADQARYFFNSGGKIRVTSARSGGAGSAQNNAWSNLLSSAGTISFGAIESFRGSSTVLSPNINFYNLTNSFQTLFTESLSAPYTGNTYSIQVRSDVANNVNGGATQLTFLISFVDTYVYTGSGTSSAPDLVDGTLTVTVEELRAQGVLQNGTLSPGVFTITRPSYSITSISGS